MYGALWCSIFGLLEEVAHSHLLRSSAVLMGIKHLKTGGVSPYLVTVSMYISFKNDLEIYICLGIKTRKPRIEAGTRQNAICYNT